MTIRFMCVLLVVGARECTWVALALFVQIIDFVRA